VKNIVGAAGIALLALTVTSGIMLSSECYTSIYWSNWGYQKTKELAQLSDPGIFVSNRGDTLHYRLLQPVNYDPTKKYPLLISLPYGGQPATDTIRQIQGAVAAELLTSDGNRENYPAFIFIPGCPPGASWGGIPNYPAVDSLVFDAIIALDQRFSIDEKRRYVVGISLGGYGAWDFICKHPDLFAAAIPVSGGGDPKLAPNAIHVAVWAFHGAKDRNVPVINSRNMINAIKNAGGNPKYTEFPNEGHNIWNMVSTTPGLLDWLFAQHRDK
jgi:predicted peptidase